MKPLSCILHVLKINFIDMPLKQKNMLAKMFLINLISKRLLGRWLYLNLKAFSFSTLNELCDVFVCLTFIFLLKEQFRFEPSIFSLAHCTHFVGKKVKYNIDHHQQSWWQSSRRHDISPYLLQFPLRFLVFHENLPIQG